MARYIIEASHDGLTHGGFARMLKAFAEGGAHWVQNAEWGCDEGIHKCWIVIEADDDADARRLLAPTIGNVALLVKLDKFTPEEINATHDTDEAE